MKVLELKNPNWGIAFTRISEALHKHAPDWITWTQSLDDAELLFAHIIGSGEEKWLQIDKPKIIFQHCYFTAGCVPWHEYWKKAKLTVSFHDLTKYVSDSFNFYPMPLGADPHIFNHIYTGPRPYKAIVTGEVYETEALDKVFEAIKSIEKAMIHTGRNFGWDKKYYKNSSFVPDEVLVKYLNASEYVPSLREHEGFELMAIEGLMCGARPIVYDLDTYRWYKKYAEIIDPDADITQQLINIFKNTARIVTPEERTEIVNTFSWENIMRRLYEQIQKAL
jgi:glycosyltransferase involved in cell wall biosynthesis